MDAIRKECGDDVDLGMHYADVASFMLTNDALLHNQYSWMHRTSW